MNLTLVGAGTTEGGVGGRGGTWHRGVALRPCLSLSSCCQRYRSFQRQHSSRQICSADCFHPVFPMVLPLSVPCRYSNFAACKDLIALPPPPPTPPLNQRLCVAGTGECSHTVKVSVPDPPAGLRTRPHPPRGELLQRTRPCKAKGKPRHPKAACSWCSVTAGPR